MITTLLWLRRLLVFLLSVPDDDDYSDEEVSAKDFLEQQPDDTIIDVRE